MPLPTIPGLSKGIELLEQAGAAVRDFNPVEALFGHWTPVASTNITAFKYDAQSQTLSVKFHGERVYQYGGVPQNVVDAFASASSKGKYLNENIKHQYLLV